MKAVSDVWMVEVPPVALGQTALKTILHTLIFIACIYACTHDPIIHDIVIIITLCICIVI